MKSLVFISSLFLCTTAWSQVQIDQTIELTGADGTRAVHYLEAPVNGTDAVNKDYVDNAVAASGGGGVPTMMSAQSGSGMIFVDAVAYCTDLTEGGYTDWRMPTLTESLYFARSSMSSNYVWTISESEGLDYATNQNYITVRLSDGRWRNGGSSTFFFPSRSVSASSLSNASWTTVASFTPLNVGGTIVPTSLVLFGGINSCSGDQRYRLVYNILGGGSVTSTEYQITCSGSNVVNLASIPIFPGSSQLTSIDVQHYRAAGTTVGSTTLTISGYETQYSQTAGSTFHARCVR